jgi:hypothetical protein
MDEGLKELATLRRLRAPVQAHANTTDEDVAASQKALPDCRITHRRPAIL